MSSKGDVMALDYPKLLADLRVESDLVIERLTALAEDHWTLPTPAQGWSIRDQVSHLAFFDDSTILALRDAREFRSHADELMASGMDFPDRIAKQHRAMAPATLLKWFIDSRRRLLSAFMVEDPRRRLPWFGPDMSVASSATARLMETWAHGQDIYDALGLTHPASPGLRGIAHLGVATFAFSHTVHGLPVPNDTLRVELRSPTGELWTWGPPDAPNSVIGTATDFVLTVTQRRNWRETGPVNSDTRFWGQIRGAEAIETAVVAVDMSNAVAGSSFRQASMVVPEQA
jgi:uncharacterized protein (TIGR03084 family)